MANSLRDEVKDAISEQIRDFTIETADLSANIADSIFGVLGITEDQQDKPLFLRG